MKKILLIILPLLFIGCSTEIPSEQQSFIDEWDRIKKDYNNASTTDSKQRYKDAGYDFLKKNKSKINSWYGKVIDIKSENRIVVKHGSIQYILKPMGEHTPSITKVKKGDKIVFSGILDGESSITTSGGINSTEMIVIINKLTNLDLSQSFYVYIPPTPKELSDKWWSYSSDKFESELSSIMLQKKKNGGFKYPNYPEYSWSEPMGYTTLNGKLTYKQYGEGSAYGRASQTSVSKNGNWKIQWAPATNSNPFDSDIIFTINKEVEGEGRFSDHIGSDNKLWTPIKEFLRQHFDGVDAQKMMAYGDSLRNAFMNENGLTIGQDGRFKKGNYKDGKRHGEWEEWYSNDNVEKGAYKDGKKDGKWTWFKDNRKASEIFYKYGKEVELRTYWFKNGAKMKKGAYKDGKKDGKWTFWHMNKQKRKEGTYKDGKKDGKWTYWDYNGKVVTKNYSLSFDGVNDYVSTDKWFSGVNNVYTLMVNFRLNQLPNESSEWLLLHRGHFQDKGIAVGTDGSIVGFDRNGTGNNDTWVKVIHDNLIVDHWYNVAFIANDNSLKLYIDGEKVSTAERTFGNTDWSKSHYGSFFGGSANYGGYAKVIIDDISIWSTQLTNSDIQLYMTSSPTGDKPGLVGYWNFNEGYGTTLKDLTSNGNNGTINGAIWSDDVR